MELKSTNLKQQLQDCEVMWDSLCHEFEFPESYAEQQAEAFAFTCKTEQQVFYMYVHVG